MFGVDAMPWGLVLVSLINMLCGLCSVGFGVSGEPLEASGVRSSTPDPSGSLSIKMPTLVGIFTVWAPTDVGVLSEPAWL